MADAKISALTAYTALQDTDVLPVVETAGPTTKKTAWSNIKSVLKSYFDTQYGAWATFDPTVTLVGGSGNTTPVYTTNSGRYTRVGNLIFVKILLTGDGGSEGAGSGVINVALPVTAGSSALSGYVIVGRYTNSTTLSQVNGQIAANATTIALRKITTATAQADMTGADQNNATREIALSFWYEGS
jgi:hypothetical protein